MRILYVAESFSSGVFEIVRILAEGLAERGHTTAIAYGQRVQTPARVREEIDEAVALYPMPWGTRRTPAQQLKAARRLRQVVRSFEPDAVHLQSSLAGIVGAAAVPRDVPTLYSPQAYSFTMNKPPLQRRVLRALDRMVARRTTVTAAVSHDEARLAREVGAARVEVVENGVPELDDDRLPEVADRRKPRVVALGRIDDQRRPEACARILGGVADLAEIAWIGGGPDDSPGVQALREADVSITGWLGREEAVDQLKHATAYLHWTGWDGLPLSILEAMARDVVVVASDIGPNREVLGGEQVTSTEAEAIALLRSVLTDEETRAAWLDRQRERRSLYGAGRMVERAIEVYSGVVEAAPVAAR